MAKSNETIDGVEYQITHSGQKQAYGDTFYEYAVFSDRPASEVEAVCREKIHKAMSLAEFHAYPV